MNRKRNQSGKFVKETQQDNESRLPQVAYWLGVVILVIPWIYAMIKLGVVDKFAWLGNELFSCNCNCLESSDKKKNGW